VNALEKVTSADLLASHKNIQIGYEGAKLITRSYPSNRSGSSPRPNQRNLVSKHCKLHGCSQEKRWAGKRDDSRP